MPFPIAPPVSPMLAKLARELPASGGKLGDLLYEPKWDGFRAIVFRDGDDIEIGSRNEKPLTRYFPDLVEPLRANLPERCVVDGEVVIATERGLDFDRLSLRIHPAESRVAMLAEETPGRVRRVRPARRGRHRPARAAVPRATGAPREAALKQAQGARVPHPGHHRPRHRGASGSSASRARVSTAWSPSRSTVSTKRASAPC